MDERQTDRLPWQRVAFEALCTLALMLFSLYFATAQSYGVVQFYKVSSLLLLYKASLELLFYFIRLFPKTVSWSWYSWLISFGGLTTPLLLRPAVQQNELLIADALQFAGIVLQLYSLTSINRSFGIVAANRGVKRGGAYRLIRHPLYLSYTLSELGFLFSNATLFNAVICISAFVFQILRIFDEERHLSQNAEYCEYAKLVRRRLIPGVF